MKKFLFILQDGKRLGNRIADIKGDLPSYQEIADVLIKANKIAKANFVVIDFKEIAND